MLLVAGEREGVVPSPSPSFACGKIHLSRRERQENVGADIIRPLLKPKRARLFQTGSFRVIISELHSAGDLAAAQAASADVDMLGRAVHDGLDALHIGLPGTVSSSVGVGDSNAERHALFAEFALCHFLKHLRACVS